MLDREGRLGRGLPASRGEDLGETALPPGRSRGAPLPAARAFLPAAGAVPAPVGFLSAAAFLPARAFATVRSSARERVVMLHAP